MRKPKGIALFLVLTILGVLTTMLGAFMTLNHSNFSLLSSSMEQAEATQACLSGYNYALYRIEHDKSWGKQAFQGLQDAAPPIGTPLDGALSCYLIEPSRLCYRLEGTRMSFEITVVNNLPVSSRTGGSPDPDTRPGDMPVIASDALYLRIVGRSGRATRRAEAVLHTAPAFDSSALSNGDLEIRQGKVVVDSNDKMRNFIKSNGDINLPRINSGGNVRFRHTGDTSPTKKPPYGYAMARGTIRSGATNLGQDDQALADANRDSQGLLAPRIQRKNEILNLDFQDIKLPPGASSSLPPGNYVFTTTKVNIPVQINYSDTEGNPQTTAKNLRITVPALVRRNFETGAVEKVWWSDSDIYIPPATATWLPGFGGASITQLGGESLAEYTGESEVIAGEPPIVNLAPGVDADLWGANVVVQPDFQVKVDGDFGLLYERRSQRGTVQEDANGINFSDYEPDKSSKDALLVLGNGTDGSSLQATGKVDIRQVAGKGAILARDDLSLNGTLAAEGKGVEGGGLALLSERDVILEVPEQTSQEDTITDTLRNTVFTGLVYAERDFIVRPLDSQNSAVTRSLDITGSVVARQGRIAVEGTESVRLTYDPKYLDDIVKDLSNNRIKLERWSFTFR